MLTFRTCVENCLKDLDFVKEFDRLTQSNMRGGSPSAMESLVDKACGYEESQQAKEYKLFTAFVFETVWRRLPEAVKDPLEVIEPPPGDDLRTLLGISKIKA